MVRDALADEWYVYLTVNERHIPHRKAYVEDVDDPHDILVHGCDDDEDTFTVLGYDEEQMFRTTTVAQDSFCTAFEAMGDRLYHDTGIVLYRFDGAGHYDMDLGFVAEVIEEYLEGRDTSRRYRDSSPSMSRAWGTAGLTSLADSLESYSRGEREFDILGLQVFWEHKHMMVARAEHCARLSVTVSVLPQLQRIERQAWTLRTMMLETLNEDRREFGCEAVALLEELATCERAALRDMVEDLRRA